MNPDTLLTLYLALWMGVLGAVLGSFFDCAAARRAAGAGWIPRGPFPVRRLRPGTVRPGPDPL